MKKILFLLFAILNSMAKINVYCIKEEKMQYEGSCAQLSYFRQRLIQAHSNKSNAKQIMCLRNIYESIEALFELFDKPNIILRFYVKKEDLYTLFNTNCEIYTHKTNNIEGLEEISLSLLFSIFAHSSQSAYLLSNEEVLEFQNFNAKIR